MLSIYGKLIESSLWQWVALLVTTSTIAEMLFVLLTKESQKSDKYMRAQEILDPRSSCISPPLPQWLGICDLAL